MGIFNFGHVTCPTNSKRADYSSKALLNINVERYYRKLRQLYKLCLVLYDNMSGKSFCNGNYDPSEARVIISVIYREKRVRLLVLCHPKL